MKSFCLFLFLILLVSSSHARRIVNVYAWGGEIPKTLIEQFEKKTGIIVHFSTYESNETLYAKIRAGGDKTYDVILPSAYFVERMKKQGMLLKLNHHLIPNLKYLEPLFSDNAYDPKNHYSVPIIWGITGIFYNKHFIKHPPTSWQALWKSRWRKQLMLLDDSREIFAIALMSLGFNPNDADPQHIQAAFHYLEKLTPNIKLFASESLQAIMIDEDALVGLAWNGDVFKAQLENQDIAFTFPKEGFVIWVDCLSILRHAAHVKEAYEFINFLLTPGAGKQLALAQGHAITNAEAKKRLPAAIRNNPLVYPPLSILKHGFFQRDLNDNSLIIYNNYWQQLKMSL